MKIIHKPSCGIRAVFVRIDPFYLFFIAADISYLPMENRNKNLGHGRAISILVRLVAGLLATIFILFSCRDRSHGRLEISFLDVGQGDSVLIRTPSERVVMIDGGPDDKVLRGLGGRLPFYRRGIDVVVLSHYHDDHIAGLIETIRRYKVRTLIYPGDHRDSLLVAELLEAASETGTKVEALEDRAEISLGEGCGLNLLNPAVLGVPADPNNSIAARLDCPGMRFLSSGDNDRRVEEALIASGWPLEADIFKASHHGSKTANSTAFLEKVSPRLIAVSVGTDNRFGHPSPETIEAIGMLGIPIARTDESGTLVVYGGNKRR